MQNDGQPLFVFVPAENLQLLFPTLSECDRDELVLKKVALVEHILLIPLVLVASIEIQSMAFHFFHALAVPVGPMQLLILHYHFVPKKKKFYH